MIPNPEEAGGTSRENSDNRSSLTDNFFIKFQKLYVIRNWYKPAMRLG